MQRGDWLVLGVNLLVTLALVAGLVLFVRYVWPLLPTGFALLGFILLAVVVIGYPIYALARLSDRYLQRKGPPGRTRRGPPP